MELRGERDLLEFAAVLLENKLTVTLKIFDRVKCGCNRC